MFDALHAVAAAIEDGERDDSPILLSVWRHGDEHALTVPAPGSLGIAISEAVEDAATHDDTNYSLGSVLNHVCLHQTVIGLEAKEQMALAGDYPDVVIGCCGGGSNFYGLAAPYFLDKMNGANIDILGAEPTACPTMTRGHFHYDFGDSVGMTPLVPMHTLGHTFVPAPLHALHLVPVKALAHLAR